MNKIVHAVIFFFFTVMSMSAFAQNMKKSVEIGGFYTDSSVSSSPVTGFSASGNSGIGIKAIFSDIPNFNNGVDLVFGLSSHNTNLSLMGTGLGKVDSETIMGGVRYRFKDSADFQPYVGVGVHYTSFSGSLANSTVRVNQNNGGFGTMIEAGVHIPVKTEIIDYVSIGVQKFWNPSFMLETSVGAAKISDVNLNQTRFGIFIGKTF